MTSRSARIDANEKRQLFREEELAAQRAAFIGRSVALLAIAPLVTVLTPWPGPLFLYVFLLVFGLIGWASWRVMLHPAGRLWHRAVLVALDFALLATILMYPNPLVLVETPPQLVFRFGSFIYLFVLLAGLAYVYQPRLVLLGGLSGAVSWAIGVWVVVRLPDTVVREELEGSLEEAMALQAQVTFVDLDVRLQEVSVLVIVTLLLAFAVKRTRSIALRQVKLARERENLGRYFPEKTAQMLAERDDPFSTPREHNCAVLFADLVAFTSWSEAHSPAETIDLLREVHGRLSAVVFENGGTLDKFIGDGLMATFGTPEPTARDASNAIAAMVGMAAAFDDWKMQAGDRAAPLNLAIGVHYGPVVIGNIGDARRLEFAVLGDTVNVASRLEGATRQHDQRAFVSDAAVIAARNEVQPGAEAMFAQLEIHTPIALKGISDTLPVWTLKGQ